MYFIVKRSLKIGGKLYKPCICYPMGERMLPTIKELKESGLTDYFEKPVFFQNGKLLVKKDVEAETPVKSEKKSHKKAKSVEVPEVTEITETVEENTEGL